MTRQAGRKVVAFAEPTAPVLPDARLTVAQAAAEAAVSEHTIRRAYVHGHLPVHRFGFGARSLRITRRELLAWLEAGGQTAPKKDRAAR